MTWRGCVATQPDLLDAECCRRPDDRADVERLPDGVQQQAEPSLGAPAPVAVEPLHLGRAELPRAHRRTSSTRYPARAANRDVSQPFSSSQRCSESEPRLRWTTR